MFLLDFAFLLMMMGFILYTLFEFLSSMMSIETLMAWIIAALWGMNAFYNNNNYNNNDDDDIHHNPTMEFMAKDAEYECDPLQEEQEQDHQNFFTQAVGTLIYRTLWLLTPHGLVFLLKCRIWACCMVAVGLCIAANGWYSFILQLPWWASFLVILTTAIVCGLIADFIKLTYVPISEAIQDAFWWGLEETCEALEHIIIWVVDGASNSIHYFCDNVWNDSWLQRGIRFFRLDSLPFIISLVMLVMLNLSLIIIQYFCRNVVWNLIQLAARKVHLIFVAQEEEQQQNKGQDQHDQQHTSWFQGGNRLFGPHDGVQENHRRQQRLHYHQHHHHHFLSWNSVWDLIHLAVRKVHRMFVAQEQEQHNEEQEQRQQQPSSSWFHRGIRLFQRDSLAFNVILVVWVIFGLSVMFVLPWCRNVWNSFWDLMQRTGRKVHRMFFAQEQEQQDKAQEQHDQQQTTSWFQGGNRLFGPHDGVQENNRRHQRLHHQHHRFLSWNSVCWDLLQLAGKKVHRMFVAQEGQQNKGQEQHQQQTSCSQGGNRLFGPLGVHANKRLHLQQHRFPHRHRHVHRPPVPVTNPAAAIAVATVAATRPSAKRTGVPAFHSTTNTTFSSSAFSATGPAPTAAGKRNPQMAARARATARKMAPTTASSSAPTGYFAATPVAMAVMPTFHWQEQAATATTTTTTIHKVNRKRTYDDDNDNDNDESSFASIQGSNKKLRTFII